LAVADGSLYYTLSGHGPVVVFAHGLGGNHRSWWQQVPYFAQHYTCLTFSHRGFAPSRDDVTGHPRPQLFAEDLTALLDHLNIERVAIVAQSMGGWTAMELALRAPDRVTSLVLCGTTGSLRHPKIASLDATRADPGTAALRARGVHPAAGDRMAREQPELHQLFIDIDHSSGGWNRDVVRGALDAMRVRAPDELRVVRCPVLALVGAEDVVCPPANVEILTTGPLRASLSTVPRAGHSVYFERAATFNEIVLNFLRQTEATR
jgi:pimeloyl-ACP methyl ester carboxylesterase